MFKAYQEGQRSEGRSINSGMKLYSLYNFVFITICMPSPISLMLSF